MQHSWLDKIASRYERWGVVFFSKSAGTSRLTAHRMPAITGDADVEVDGQQVLIGVETKIVKPEPDPKPHYSSRVTSEFSALLFTTTCAPQSQK